MSMQIYLEKKVLEFCKANHHVLFGKDKLMWIYIEEKYWVVMEGSNFKQGQS